MRSLVPGLLAVLAVRGGGPTDIPQAPPPRPAADPVARVVDLLHRAPVALDGVDLRTTPLTDVLRVLARRHRLTFVINNASLENWEEVHQAKAPWVATDLPDGLTLGRFLDLYLNGLELKGDDSRPVLLVRDYGVEIVGRRCVERETGQQEAAEVAERSGDPVTFARLVHRPFQPLVSVVAEDRPLADVLTELTRAYDLNLVIDRAARGPAARETVTARLLNVPADTALELLAGSVGLTVTRTGNAFRLGVADKGQ